MVEQKDISKKINKIFLGGTCGDSNWRDKLIPALDYYEINYFNPVVKNWTSECIEIENAEKENLCNIHLYYIDKSMTGVYSIAEAVDSSYKTIDTFWCDECLQYHKSSNVDYVIFIVNKDGFTDSQIRSFKATMLLMEKITPMILTKFCTDEDLENISSFSKEIIELSNMNLKELSDSFLNPQNNPEDDDDEEEDEDNYRY